MKNLKYKLLFIFNVMIMAFLLGVSLFNEKPVKAENNEVTISFENTEGGDETFSYFEDEVEITLGQGKIAKGTSITLKAKPEAGYEFNYWVYINNGLIKKLSDSEEVKVTVKQDYQFSAIYTNSNQVLVTYFDSTGKTIVDYKILEKGADAPNIDAPHLKGYSHKGWDKELENITTNLDLKPVYDATAWSVFRDYAGDFFRGLGLTLAFSVVSVFCALFLGAVLCLAKISNVKALKFISTAYIEIIRGVPLLLQLLLIYALMPRVDYGKYINSEVLAAILALFLNSGAYVAEIFRSGIQAVDKGQMEAGRALGLSKWQTMKTIIIPQAIKNVLPSIGNELIMVIKETSLASTVDAGIGELMSIKKQITSATFINIPPFIVIAVMYFVVTFSLSKAVRYIERRLEARD